MRKTLLLAIIILSVLLTGCKEGNKPSSDDFILVDVDATYPEKELVLQEFADVEYVALDNTDEFITQGVVKAVGKKILLVTNRRNDGNIFVFDRTGKGLRKINRLGQSGEEYSHPTEIILDEQGEEMFVVDYPARKINVYDLFGIFKRSFPFADSSYYMEMFDYDRDHLMGYKSYLPSVETEQSCYILVSKHDGSVVREMQIPFQGIETPVVMEGETSVTPQFYLTVPQRAGWLLAKPSSDTIYNCRPDGSLRPFAVRTPSIHGRNHPAVFLFPAAMSAGRYYFMQTMRKEVDFATMKGFPTTDLVYDKRENALFECTVCNGDFSNKRPVPLASKPLNREIETYETLHAPDLVEAYEKGRLKGKLKEIAAGLNEESNPVVMLVSVRK